MANSKGKSKNKPLWLDFDRLAGYEDVGDTGPFDPYRAMRPIVGGRMARCWAPMPMRRTL